MCLWVDAEKTCVVSVLVTDPVHLELIAPKPGFAHQAVVQGSSGWWLRERYATQVINVREKP